MAANEVPRVDADQRPRPFQFTLRTMFIVTTPAG